jgi:Transposase DDE domain
LAQAFPSNAKVSSSYRRMQRFIADFQLIDFNDVAWFIMRLFGFLDSQYDLTFDRTNWQWGKRDINILMLAVVYKGIAIPVYWILLNKKGNSSTRERIALLSRFITQFGKGNIRKFLADREFVGKRWFAWLKSENINFAIRIKKNSQVKNSRGVFVDVQDLFRHVKKGEELILKGSYQVTESEVFLSALRLEDNELLIIATGDFCLDAVENYGKRWQIETLFSCLKSRGFNFEDTHVTDRNRIKRLLVVAVIAFCWAHRVGEWQHEHITPIKAKKHKRLSQSIFRVGLDVISEALFKSFHNPKSNINTLILHLKIETIRGYT